MPGSDQDFDFDICYLEDDDDTITVDADNVHPYFEFQMKYPNTIVTYFVSNIRHEGNRVTLDTWDYGTAITTYDEETLRDSTRTASFTVSTGDSISLYREFRWWNHSVDSQTTTNYVALDTLDFSIEIINASNNSRLALIDSIGALRQTTAGAPPLYGTRPIIAEINYEVPSAMNGLSVRIRLIPRARGTGAEKFARYDSWGADIDQRAYQSWTSSYLAAYGGGLGKRSHGRTADAVTVADRIEVSPNPNRGTFTLTAKRIGDIPASIAIYDVNGRDVTASVPNLRKISSGESFEVKLPLSGVYFVALKQGENEIARTKIIVAE